LNPGKTNIPFQNSIFHIQDSLGRALEGEERNVRTLLERHAGNTRQAVIYQVKAVED